MRQKLEKLRENCVVFLYIFRIYSLKIFDGGGLGAMAPYRLLATLLPPEAVVIGRVCLLVGRSFVNIPAALAGGRTMTHCRCPARLAKPLPARAQSITSPVVVMHCHNTAIFSHIRPSNISYHIMCFII